MDNSVLARKRPEEVSKNSMNKPNKPPVAWEEETWMH
jgi:hypothetical protein